MVVVDGETRRLKLAPALDPLTIKDHKEKVSVLFLQHSDENNILNPSAHKLPPRLLSLVELLEKHPDADVDLVPVTLLWENHFSRTIENGYVTSSFFRGRKS